MKRKKWSHTKAFNHFGVEPKNPRWSWSGISKDKKSVVSTCWQDGFKLQEGKLVYEDSLKQDNRPGARELKRNLAYARDNCEGEFNVIVAIPKDAKAQQRSIKECFPSKIVMRLTHLDLQTGTYAAEAETV